VSLEFTQFHHLTENLEAISEAVINGAEQEEKKRMMRLEKLEERQKAEIEDAYSGGRYKNKYSY
jgi:hypothetical protein